MLNAHSSIGEMSQKANKEIRDPAEVQDYLLKFYLIPKTGIMLIKIPFLTYSTCELSNSIFSRVITQCEGLHSRQAV